MLNITNYHRSVNQNYNGVSSHIGHNGHHQWPSSKKLQLINAKGGVEKREPSYTVGGNINWYSYVENNMEVLKTRGSLKN